MSNAGRDRRRIGIVEHDEMLSRESMANWFQCDAPGGHAAVAGRRAAPPGDIICGKWRCVPWLELGSDQTFTCSKGGFQCDDHEPDEWMGIHAFSGSHISASDASVMQVRPILENSIGHMVHKIDFADLWQGSLGDLATSTVLKMINELQDPHTLELTKLGRGPERVIKVKKILKWIWGKAQVVSEQDDLDSIRKDLEEVCTHLHE